MKHNLTDKERDHVIKLLNLGMSAQETSELLGIAKSTVFYIKQAYKACLAKDYDTLTRMCNHVKATVEWAVKFTKTPFVFEVPLSEEDSATTVDDESNNRENADLQKTLTDIRDLLIEIRDILK